MTTMSEPGSSLRTWVDSPGWDWTRGRTARRWLVAAMVVTLTLSAAGILFSNLGIFLSNAAKVLSGGDLDTASDAVAIAQLGINLLAGLSLPLFVALMFVLLGPATRGVFWLRARDLDERQEARKRMIFRRCYSALGLLAGPAAIVTALIGAWVVPAAGASVADWIGAIARLLLGLAVPAMYFALLLPAMVDAWIGPDERSEPEPDLSRP
jgi:hypothetical protein